MTREEAKQQLEELEPVPPPPPGPTYEHIVGNQIRWSAKVIRYSRYRRRRRKLEKLIAREERGVPVVTDRTN
jgi:hypothetical protein